MKGIGRNDANSENVLIYGAGEAGVLLVKESRINPNFSYRIVGFLDDNPNKKGWKVYGLKVLGGLEDVEKIIEKNDVSKIIISMPSVEQSKISNISNMWEDLLETGIEYFKMGNDGESFYWCNPQINSAEEEFKLFINELNTFAHGIKHINNENG